VLLRLTEANRIASLFSNKLDWRSRAHFDYHDSQGLHARSSLFSVCDNQFSCYFVGAFEAAAWTVFTLCDDCFGAAVAVIDVNVCRHSHWFMRFRASWVNSVFRYNYVTGIWEESVSEQRTVSVANHGTCRQREIRSQQYVVGPTDVYTDWWRMLSRLAKLFCWPWSR